jgi:hypothetical protein
LASVAVGRATSDEFSTAAGVASAFVYAATSVAISVTAPLESLAEIGTVTALTSDVVPFASVALSAATSELASLNPFVSDTLNAAISLALSTTAVDVSITVVCTTTLADSVTVPLESATA